jgi:hypothetical protein
VEQASAFVVTPFMVTLQQVSAHHALEGLVLLPASMITMPSLASRTSSWKMGTGELAHSQKSL